MGCTINYLPGTIFNYFHPHLHTNEGPGEDPFHLRRRRQQLLQIIHIIPNNNTIQSNTLHECTTH